MDKLTIYLNKTNEAQFCAWLSDYCKRKQVENRIFTYTDGWMYHFYYPFNISPGYQKQVGISANFFRSTPIEVTEDEEKYTSDYYDIDNAVTVSWLEVGERMKINLEHSSGAMFCHPLFDMLAEIGNDWQETQGAIWEFIQGQTEKYHVEFTGKPSPIGDVKKINEERPEQATGYERLLNSTGKITNPLNGLNSTGVLALEIGKRALERSERDAVQAVKPEKEKHMQVNKGGRGHFPEDVWAHEQVNDCNRDPWNEVYPEWLDKVNANNTRTVNNPKSRKDQFRRIIKPEWGRPKRLND